MSYNENEYVMAEQIEALENKIETFVSELNKKNSRIEELESQVKDYEEALELASRTLRKALGEVDLLKWDDDENDGVL